jgi:hypothetical protein
MDAKLVEEAIHRAIKGGAVVAPINPPLAPRGWEENVIGARTQVQIAPLVLEEYLADLRRDRQLTRLESAYVTMPTGGGTSIGLQSIALSLLERAIDSDNVAGTVETFRSYIEKNTAPVIAVMAVAGVKTPAKVRLGPQIRLVPITSLPPSWQRGDAMGQSLLAHSDVRRTVSSALVTPLDFGPIFYWPSEGSSPSEPAQRRVRSALDDLDEARTLLSLLGITTAMRLFWVQPLDPMMGTGIDRGWLSSRDVFLGEDIEVDASAAEELAAAYFKIAFPRRQETLHIPLDRLYRAIRGRDLVDNAIDLGIALEALLLHETNFQGELRFRLSLRGAWLGGGDVREREEMQKILENVYDLRSRAVHTGKVKGTEAEKQTIERGTALCKQLIRKMIEAGGGIDDWTARLLGIHAEKA